MIGKKSGRSAREKQQAEVEMAEVLTAEKAAAATFLMAEPRGYYHVQVDAFVQMCTDSLRAWENQSLQLEQLLHEAQVEIDQLSYDNQSLKAQIEIFRVNGAPMVDANGNYVTEGQMAATAASGILGAEASLLSHEVDRLTAENEDLVAQQSELLTQQTDLLTQIAELQDALAVAQYEVIPPSEAIYEEAWSEEAPTPPAAPEPYLEVYSDTDSAFVEEQPAAEFYSDPDTQMQAQWEQEAVLQPIAPTYAEFPDQAEPVGMYAVEEIVEPPIVDESRRGRGKLFGRRKAGGELIPAPEDDRAPQTAAESPVSPAPTSQVEPTAPGRVFGQPNSWDISGGDD